VYAVRLLPQEYLQIRNTARRSKMTLIVLIASVAVFAAALIITGLIRASLHREYEALKTSNEMMMQRIESLKPVESMQNEINTLKQKVSQALKICPDWDLYIPALGNAIPPNIFLTKLTARYADGKSNVALNGRAPDQGAIYTMIAYIENVPGVSHVTCSRATEDTSSGNIEFELNIQLNTISGAQTEGNEQ